LSLLSATLCRRSTRAPANVLHVLLLASFIVSRAGSKLWRWWPRTGSRLGRVGALAAIAVVAPIAAQAQPAGKPGPMQSGQHVPAADAAPAAAASASGGNTADAKQLFANVCGWCHSSGGREAGKGPKLMGSPLTDSELIYRIKVGKTGQMPGFGSALTEQQIVAVVSYIRSLKPESASQ
jgi:mono/diheme cytochrome c family protein